jgi:fimbrial chaperone protein
VVIGQGQVAVTVNNQGNSHFRVRRVKLQGKTSGGEALETVETAGWYLLAGSQRTFDIDIPAEFCRKADLLEIVVDSDRITLTGSVNVDKAKCSAP